MRDSSDNYFTMMEQWLQVLLVVYQRRPDRQVTRYINYYLARILKHEECLTSTEKTCHYRKMQKFWRWRQAASPIN